jgi:LPXTG-site transpeptidase (sortase) family protein
LAKSVDPRIAEVGDPVLFTVQLFNNGNADALNVVLVDDIPGFLDIVSVTISPDLGQPRSIVGQRITINFGTVTPTDLYTIWIRTRVNASARPPGGRNNVFLTTSSVDDDMTNNQDDVEVIIIAPELPGTGFAPDKRTVLPPQPQNSPYTSYSGMWLEIPSLGVEMPIVGVPLTEEGWDVTWLWDNAGYLNYTAFPTWSGNTGLTGHVTLPTGLPGPFANLKELRWGDEIVIHAWGLRYSYDIRVVKPVAPGDMSVLDHKEYDWVTLITCSAYSDYLDEYMLRWVAQAVLMKVEFESSVLNSLMRWLP